MGGDQEENLGGKDCDGVLGAERDQSGGAPRDVVDDSITTRADEDALHSNAAAHAPSRHWRRRRSVLGALEVRGEEEGERKRRKWKRDTHKPYLYPVAYRV